ncbi:hypothetical protein BTUL_0064g00170 [Botrytis tulipae]|uniref:Uncharacterized protein n=1 Tax=Botrytis tulipae TaxID=87230 RepID=A0A4Z1EY06_9HELO|nr:hypothetical protein BTUL_0064g00170 [Botrytis tulipae]
MIRDYNVLESIALRLVLEAGMADDDATLVVLLDQGLSYELADRAITAEPPMHSADAYAAFCQKLENRRKDLKYACKVASPPVPVPAGDSVDPGSRRWAAEARLSHKECGECYRCGSAGHLPPDRLGPGIFSTLFPSPLAG